MAYGYSVKLVQANANADSSMLGVKLGRKCIANNIPVTAVAKHFDVSRQTIYNWFCGVYAPQKHTALAVHTYLLAE